MTHPVTSTTAVDAFNALPQERARAVLAACLDVSRWVDELVAGRPYADAGAALEQAGSSAAQMTDAEVQAALRRHPRIGERAGEGQDGEISAQEQSAVDAGDPAVAAALARGNAAYEERFDQVFLIRAAGRSAADVLAELERRLDNNEEQETAEVVEQLTEISLLRLRRVLAS